MTAARSLQPYGERRMHLAARDPKAERPPSDIALELTILADVTDQDAERTIEAIKDIVRPEDFFNPTHKAIFAAIIDLHSMRRANAVIGIHEISLWLRVNSNQTGSPFVRDLSPIEIATLSDVAKSSSFFDDVALAKVQGRVESRARRLRELADTRRTIEKLWTAAAIGYSGDVDALKFAVEDVRKSVTGLGAAGTAESEHIAAPMDRVFQRYLGVNAKPKADLITTGFPDLDRLVSFEPGSLVIVGARSGRGKSSLAMQCAIHVAESHGPCLYFSSEMPSDQLALRAACTMAKVDSKRVRRAECGNEEGSRLMDTYNRLKATMTWMNDKPGQTIDDIAGIARRESRRLQRENGTKLKLVVIDYLQRIRPSKNIAYQSNREQQVASIAQSAKELALELNCCVLVPAQLNADGDKRDDERPRVSDLRESKTIESEADAVILIHNPHYQARVEDLNHDTEQPEACEITLGKGRNDGNGTTMMWFTPMYSRFSTMSDDHKLEQQNKMRDKYRKGGKQ